MTYDTTFYFLSYQHVHELHVKDDLKIVKMWQYFNFLEFGLVRFNPGRHNQD